MRRKISIAIDGPASAGKSTVAKLLAQKLNYIYVDTGAMYRVLTYAVLKAQLDPGDENKILSLLKKMTISFTSEDLSQQRVWMNGEDVTEEIRADVVTNNVSEVSAHKKIREEMVARQQAMGADGGVVMDGRDIGTAVMPKAELKIFLVASVEERARRRYEENISKGMTVDFETLKREIAERDYKDSHRKNSPLVQAADAVKIDTTGMTIEEVVSEIEKIIEI
ncbi:(d)CMP kinase [Vagococcus elongatus]|uniref:Cytidylate kinase n=1 Tax=Vagococcus elongatus TaxID=180344 RepID=A0A430B5D3_9ENTE|nr:(d)CMP kinase [Vagococcus elongatus]RSU15576.1 cytidylate kinase [Vagococcus elongatus]